MARTLISKLASSFLFATRSAAATTAAATTTAGGGGGGRIPVVRLRRLFLLAGRISGGASVRCFSTQLSTSSLNDPSPNCSNLQPKETIPLDGCDFEHWLIVVDPPDPSLTRDEIIHSYIKKLAEVVGSEEEARMKIYSVSTKHCFAFGALVSEELSYKMKSVEDVRLVLADSYVDCRNKDYGGEPFIDGHAVPYDPKYHEQRVRNNALENKRLRRNERNFELHRENTQTYQNRDVPPPMSGSNNTPPNWELPKSSKQRRSSRLAREIDLRLMDKLAKIAQAIEVSKYNKLQREKDTLQEELNREVEKMREERDKALNELKVAQEEITKLKDEFMAFKNESYNELKESVDGYKPLAADI